jgi:hypothetical protein
MRGPVLAALTLAACAAGSRPAPSSALVVGSASGSGRPAPPADAPPDGAAPATLDEAWRLWFEGKREPALTRFRAVRQHLESLAARGDAGARKGLEPGPAGVASDAKDAIVIASDAEVLSCDRDGTPRARSSRGAESYTSTRSPAAILSRDGAMQIVEARTLAPIGALPVAGDAVPPALSEDAIGWVEDRDDGGSVAHVFDLATRSERWAKRAPKDVKPMALGWGPGFFYVAGMPGALFDAEDGRVVARFGGPGAITQPAFSADGKLVAVTSPGVGAPGLVELLDRRGKRLASASCGFTANAGFSSNGRWLVVGDLRRACLFELPKLRLLARSAEIRPFAGPDDDLQELQQLQFIAGDRIVFLRTGDGSAALAGAGGLSIFWRGRGELVDADEPGILAVIDREDKGEVARVDPRGKVITRPLREDEKAWDAPVDGVATPREKVLESLLSARFCHIGDRSFPIEACAP